MKNIQMIDDAENGVYDCFQATEDEFNFIFKEGTDICFEEDLWSNGVDNKLKETFKAIYSRPIEKKVVNGIHGIIFFGMEFKKPYYPTLKDAEAINPDGTFLRRAKKPRQSL